MSFFNPITFGGTPAFLGGTTINEGDVILGDTIVNEGDINTTDITVTGIPDFLIQTINGNTAIRMGEEAGNLSQGNASIAIGSYAGANTQSTLSIAIGHYAGNYFQGSQSVAMGSSAAQTSQGTGAVSVGFEAGQTNQRNFAVSVGSSAGRTSQGSNAISFGRSAGSSNQGSNAVSLGVNAGKTSQGSNAVAVGPEAGQTSQGIRAVAIGDAAGYTSQGSNAVAVGHESGSNAQRPGAVAVGRLAGGTSQGSNAIAIGSSAGLTNQAANCIVINATGVALNNTTTSSCKIAPIRDYASVARRVLLYDSSTNEAGTNSANFVIDASNRVGIGIATPLYTLDVNGTARIAQNLYFNNQAQNNMITLYGTTGLADTGQYGFGINSSTLRYNVPSTAAHRWYHNTTNTMTLGSTGLLTTTGGFSGSGASLTALNASQLTSGTVPDARISGTYTGMTNLTGSGTVDFSKFLGNAADSVGAPSFSWTGDTNTGMYTPGADQVALATAGASRLYVGTTGNIGIGNTAPGYKLDVSGTGRFTGALTATSFDGLLLNGVAFVNNQWYQTPEVQNRLYFATSSHTYFASPTNIIFRPGGSGSDIVSISEPATNVGRVTAGQFYGSGVGLTAIPAGQLTGTVPNAAISGSYSGITTLTATSFVGSGASLTALNASQLTSGTVPDARISGAYSGITTLTATSFVGSGASLTALNASQLTSGTVPDARIPNLAASKITAGTFDAGRYDFTRTGTDGASICTGWSSGLGLIIRFNASGSCANRTQVWGSTSDERLKTNITDARQYLADLRNVRVRKFAFKDTPNDMFVGVIAQELQSVFPGLVEADEEGILSVKMSIFTPMLITAVQELATKNEQQDAVITDIQEKIKKLEEELEARKSFEAIMLARLEALERSQPP